MEPLNRRDFLSAGARSLIKLSGGLYVAGYLLPLSGCGSSITAQSADKAMGSAFTPQYPVREITPVSELYVQSVRQSPGVSSDDWRLEISGSVSNNLSFSYQDFQKLEQTTMYNTLICVGNEVGGRLTGHCEWTGVKLKTILERAGLLPEALDVAIFARDSYSDSFPVSKAMEGDVILAYKINGEPLTVDHGFPVRAIVPNIYGMKNVKWIDRIVISQSDYRGFWQKRGWSESAEIKTYSTIQSLDRPSTTEPARLSGIAYAGDRGVSGVQISLDGGSTWDEAVITPALSKYSWNVWTYDLPSSAKGRYSITIRAVEKSGVIQGAGGLNSHTKPDGANGYHQISIDVA